ncbi:MAG TPA: sugar ABC transporter substrate-binding protein [Chloroflexi bacterium]|nr:sugar ABC transporter substrate-binding protein [Chloroflexota bacterium]
MFKKRFVCVLLLLAILLAACGRGATPADDQVTVGFAAASAGWPWYATFIETLENRAKQAGWELTVLGADGDVAAQVNQIQDLIAADVDYLVIGPVDGTAIVPAVKDAHRAGIPVIIIGNTVDEEADEAISAVRVPDDYQMGKDSAELMVEALGGEGRIFVVEGLPGQPAVIARLEAYDDVFGETNIEIVDSQPANWDSTKAVEVTEAMLTRYPDIDGILSMDGSMSPGIVQVVNERGLDIPIVGLGGTASELALVKDGSVYGTTCMSPGANANAAADAIEGLIAGRNVEKFQIVPSPKTTQENADQCPGDW